MRRRVVPASPRGNAKRPPNGSVVGLDLSLTATGMCAIPLAWGQRVEQVSVRTFGVELHSDANARQRVERAAQIVDAVLDFLREHQARAVYVEDHAYGAGGARANETIEMTGAVKLRVYEDWGVVALPVVASSARKTLLQRLPSPRGQKKGFLKKWVVANVKRLGGPAERWSEDEVDAFVVANHGVMVQGGVALTFEGR